MNEIKFVIYFDKCYLSKTRNQRYKYLFSDNQNNFNTLNQKEKDDILRIGQSEKDEILIFATAEEAFEFFDKEKNNFPMADECVVAAIRSAKNLNLRLHEKILNVGHEYESHVSEIWDESKNQVIESHFGKIIEVYRDSDDLLRKIK